MIIDVDRLPQDGLQICKDFEVLSAEIIEEDAVFLSPLYVELSIKKSGDNVFIKGQITTNISFVCSRCLAPYEFPVDSAFDIVCIPEELDVVKEQLEEEDLGQLFYHHRKIDLREIVMEQLNLTFPLKPICSEDCHGICPVCGKRIQDGQCSCVSNDSDPRLEKLKKFLREKR